MFSLSFCSPSVTDWGSAVALLDKPLWENPWKSQWTKWMINDAPSPNKTIVVLWSWKSWIHEQSATHSPSGRLQQEWKYAAYSRSIMILLLQDFRKKNTEHMPPEVVSLLRCSERAFLHHLVASNPEALFRWGVLRATFRILTVFKNMGRKRAELSRSLIATYQAAFSAPKKTIDVCLQDRLVTA